MQILNMGGDPTVFFFIPPKKINRKQKFSKYTY